MESRHRGHGDSLAQNWLDRPFASAGRPLRIGLDPYSMGAILTDGRFSSGARCVRQSSQSAMS